MAVDDRLDIGPNLVNLAVDETLQIRGATARIDRLIVQVVFDDVLRGHQGRRSRAGNEVMLGVPGRPDTDMAESVNHALVGQDAIGENQIGDAFGVLLLGCFHGRVLCQARCDPY